MAQQSIQEKGPCDAAKPGEPEACQTKCLQPTLPGVISSRACVLYGARWVLAPVKNVIHLVHGPVDCAYYSGTVRRRCYEVFSTDMREEDVIFGGSDKLEGSIRDALLLRPDSDAVLVYGTCTSGLIGEDVEKTCRIAQEKHGIPVVYVNCAGFRGESQKSGHDEAARVLYEHFISRGKSGIVRNGVNILGEFDMGGDLEEIEKMLSALGVKVLCAVSGRCDAHSLALAKGAELNVVHCRSTGGMLAKYMEKDLGIPQIKASFFGIEETGNSLREIGGFFRAKETEEYIACEEKKTREDIKPYVSALTGKKIAMFFGASRMASMTRAFRGLGMDVVFAGSQHGSAGDYAEAERKLEKTTVMLDDAGLDELCAFLRKTGPDLMVGGTREKYAAHKMGVPFLLFPQIERPYAGYTGYVNLARDVAFTVNAPAWALAEGMG